MPDGPSETRRRIERVAFHNFNHGEIAHGDLMADYFPEDRDVSADEADRYNADERLPDELPPVKPPSAGFIVQLFFVPALIVLAVVGVWVLFGKLASGDRDWRSLVTEMRSSNTHRRDRAATALAHMLRNDERSGAAGQQLARNPEVATELANLLDERLQLRSPSDNDLSQQAFLARTLGFLEVPRVVLPVLREAMQPEQDRDVRKNAIAAIALVAGRAVERGAPLDDAKLVDDLVRISSDPDPLVRQLGAFTLGVIPAPESKQRLRVMISDSDANARINAAVGLARQNSTEGVPVFKVVLGDAADPVDEDEARGESLEERRRNADIENFERSVAVKNALKAVCDLAAELSAKQQAELLALIRPLADDHPHQRIRLDALRAIRALEEPVR